LLWWSESNDNFLGYLFYEIKELNSMQKKQFISKHNRLNLVINLVVFSSYGYLSPIQASTNLDTVTVNSDSKSTRNEKMMKLKKDIIHTEVVTAKKIAQKQAASLAQAIANEPGVKVNTDCSLCGVKRVMLNGLKGEHTTIMTNGVPNSSLMEGFYGFDAIPTAGITSVEISRGAGASMLAPGAIGGTINVITAKPYNDSLMFDLSRGNYNYHKYQFVGTKVSHDKDTAISFAAQSDYRGQIDQDNNYINESPELTNRAMNLQVWHQISENDNIDFRIVDQFSEVFGGPMLNTPFARSKSDARTQVGGNAQFIGGNVGNRPTAGTTARDFLENIISTKQSYTTKWEHYVNDDLQTLLVGSYVDATLDSIYENITYKADQDIYYIDARGYYFFNEQHSLTFGLDLKTDSYDSVSTGGSNPSGDSYKLNVKGLYLKELWTPTNSLEASFALRVDDIDVSFLEQNRKFKETVFAPRMHIKYLHDFNWTSRFSAGKGYRVPLAFFETDHGIVDNPLVMDVDKLEKSNSLQYSLDFNNARTDFLTTYSWTAVKNLAMIDPSTSSATKIINSPQEGAVQHIDVSITYQLTANWSIGTTAEVFMYDKNYRNTFVVIPTEERVRLMVDYDNSGWEVISTLSWVGSRKYSDYTNADYNNHYQDAANTISNGTKSPDYFTLNLKVNKQIGAHGHWNIYAGANNLLNYTQVGSGSSPLFYDTNGDVDVTHIWGPLRAREIYAGIRANF
jgi:outer membrane receptor protein involved in Fe transport